MNRKTKQLLLTITALLAMGVCALGISGCDEQHRCNYTNEITHPTCTERGYTTHTCECGESYVDTYMEALGHSYAETVKEPTCTEGGYTTFVCECGDSYGGAHVEKAPHKFEHYVSNADGMETATCSFTGCTEKEERQIVFLYEGNEIKGLTYYGMSLTEISIPKTINGVEMTSIGENAFIEQMDIEKITIPNGVISIGNEAFSMCDSLISIHIPESVTSIGEDVFNCCAKLTEVIISRGVTTIGAGAFCGNVNLTSIIVDENNTAYKSVDGNLYTKDGQTLIQYSIGKTDTSFVIPDDVTLIGIAAFFDCDNLINVTIGNNVLSIDYAAFMDCNNLTSVTMGDNVTSIGYGAFGACDRLTSVTIPNSVTTIGELAFCESGNLTNITFKGTMTEWNAIEKGDNWNYDVPATKVVCLDGAVAL